MNDVRRFIVDRPGVMIPARVADWIVQNTNFEQVRHTTRGRLDDELWNALGALHVVAKEDRARRAADASRAVRGTARGTEPVPASELAAPSKYIDVATMAARLGMSERGARKALREGRLSGVLIGGRWMASIDDVDRFKSTRG